MSKACKCDLCGKLFESNRIVDYPYTLYKVYKEKFFTSAHESIDMCDECYSDFCNFIREKIRSKNAE